MKITYDSEADALYIELREVPACDGIDIEDGVSADFDESGHVIGFEILDASKRLTETELSKVIYENLVSEKSASTKLPA
jgi:uncharacterized protein YuzE